MKSAEELFEELGYKFVEDGYGFITYEFNNGIEYPTVIEFDDDGTFIAYIKYTKEPVYITFELLKAINKQYEELGWSYEKAKKMFKELGYKIVTEDEKIIKFEHHDNWSRITFDKAGKTYWVDCLGRAECIFPSLHEALNQMVKELEWK